MHEEVGALANRLRENDAGQERARLPLRGGASVSDRKVFSKSDCRQYGPTPAMSNGPIRASFAGPSVPPSPTAKSRPRRTKVPVRTIFDCYCG
jgi:hypothetical protein